MKRFNTALVLSIALHAGVLALAYISWKTAPPKMAVPSVPIELVSEVPAREQAEAPVDDLAVKPPEPEPAPPEPVVEPTPVPAPKLPVPTPQKPATPKPEPKLEKKPDPKPVEKPKPDPKGVKKPEPQKPTKPKTSAADDMLARLAAAPSKANTKKAAQANTRKTDGASNRGTSPADAGLQNALNDLGRRLGRAWNPNCDVPGGNQVVLDVTLRLSPNGRVVKVEWNNSKSDPTWKAAYSRARAAIAQLEPYEGLPPDAYGIDIPLEFDAPSACRNR